MSTIETHRTYRQSPAEVFAALNDFPGVYRFHPLLKSSPQVDGTPATGPGAERVCHLHDGNTLHERLISATPHASLEILIVDTSMPLAKGGGRFDLEPTPDGGTELRMTMDFDMKMGILGKVMDKLVVAKKFKGNLDLLLAALGEYLDTGEEVPKEWKPVAA